MGLAITYVLHPFKILALDFGDVRDNKRIYQMNNMLEYQSVHSHWTSKADAFAQPPSGRFLHSHHPDASHPTAYHPNSPIPSVFNIRFPLVQFPYPVTCDHFLPSHIVHHSYLFLCCLYVLSILLVSSTSCSLYAIGLSSAWLIMTLIPSTCLLPNFRQCRYFISCCLFIFLPSDIFRAFRAPCLK